MKENKTPAEVGCNEGLGGWAKVPPEFSKWWNDDRLTPDNPFEPKTAAYWAWEGWQACKAVTLTDPDLRARIALQLREIERLRAALAAAPVQAALQKTVCPYCESEWTTGEQHDANLAMLAAAPLPAERVPLTDEQIMHIAFGQRFVDGSQYLIACVRAIEAAHGIKPPNAQAERPSGAREDER